MDLKQMLSHSRLNDDFTQKWHSDYCFDLIGPDIVELTIVDFENRLVNSLNQLIETTKLSCYYLESKHLSIELLDKLIEANREVIQGAVENFAAFTMDFIDSNLLPKYYHLQEEGIIQDETGKLIYDDEIVLRYAKPVYLPYLQIFTQVVNNTHLLLLDIKDQIINDKLNNKKNTAAVTPLMDGKQDFFIDYNKIVKLYDFCNQEQIFKAPFDLTKFLDCFDKNKSVKIYPVFKPQVKFVYILSLIDYVNDNIALQHFGIKNYRGQKARVKNLNAPDTVFRNAVSKIINN